ncbi:hypothetical protein F4805DRAFT_255229 [Annulohypoxylon moriforme]|nr:hypothetical protein F4805DRAFT_255229 [Annulohypoxylon moriforme]
MPSEVTKDETLESLGQSVPAFGQTLRLWNIQQHNGLPKGVHETIQHLPTIFGVLEHGYKNLEATDGTGEDCRKILVMYELSETYRNTEGYLRDVSVAVANSDNTNADNIAFKLKRYQEVITKHDNTKLEGVMLKLLEQAAKVVGMLPDNGDLKERMRKAQNAFAALRPSPNGVPNSGTVMTNHGSGNQFLNNGAGSQNQCVGGNLFTGSVTL